MLNRLLGRHRKLRIGATIVGASALAVGFASPAFAGSECQQRERGQRQRPELPGGDGRLEHHVLGHGGVVRPSSTKRLVVTWSVYPALGQPLDYGCPGLNGEAGQAQPAAQTTSFTAALSARFEECSPSRAPLA